MGDERFYFKNGKVVHGLKEFYEYIKQISKEEYSHHVTLTKNDFSEWIQHSIGNNELARRIKAASNVEEVESIIALEVRQQEELSDESDEDSEEIKSDSLSKSNEIKSEEEDLDNEESAKEQIHEESFDSKDVPKEQNIFDLRDERERNQLQKEEVEQDVEDLISKKEGIKTECANKNPYSNEEKKQIFARVRKPNAPMSFHSYLMFKELLFGIMFGIILGMILMAIILSI